MKKIWQKNKEKIIISVLTNISNKIVWIVLVCIFSLVVFLIKYFNKDVSLNLRVLICLCFLLFASVGFNIYNEFQIRKRKSDAKKWEREYIEFRKNRYYGGFGLVRDCIYGNTRGFIEESRISSDNLF